MATQPVAKDAVNLADAKSGGLTHEELLDKLAALDTDARPITDIASTGSSQNIKVEWAETELAAPSATNVAYDGQRDFTNDAKLGLRYANFVQTSTKMVSVGDVANMSDTVGAGTELATQVTNRLRELRNDKEARLASSLPAVPGTSGSIGSQTSGFGAMIRTGRSFGATTGSDGTLSEPDGGYIKVAPAGGTARPLTLDLIDSAILGAASRGGRPRYLVTMPLLIKGITNFLMSGSAQVATIQTNVPQSERKGVIEGDGLAGGGVAAISAVNVMVTSFGTLTLVPDFQQQEDATGITTVHLIDPDWIDVVSMGPMYNIEAQGKTGLATDRLLSTCYTLRLPSERAHATIAGITAADPVTQS